MALLGGSLGYNILKAYAGNGTKVGLSEATSYAGKSKLEILLGKDFLTDVKGSVVIDFGCGNGEQAVEMAKHGAAKVIGVDIVDRYLEMGRQTAKNQGVSDICEFVRNPSEKADYIIALDSFEHFENPESILETMHSMLKPCGAVIASFGPTWFHPYGGHLFSVFPWAHLVFTESVLIRWRSGFKSDGATKFNEVEGGLNQMTIRRFKKIVERSGFFIEELEPVPIKKLKWLANPLTQEFTTSIVRCKLLPR
ncbi:MAG: class I SAM-dependent methyltransferase [Pseudohongiella sp.]|nr:class I SAM-dependent methyltransferase [Pseudohongiella sp.]